MSGTTQPRRDGAKTAGALVMLALAFFLGTQFAADTPPIAPGESEVHSAEREVPTDEAPTIWTCSMHPQIQLAEAGACPVCAMDLVPLRASDAERHAPKLVMTDADKKLAEIQTEAVERKFVDARIRLVGRVAYDETRIKNISAYVPARIDRLYINYTGIPVKRGDHLADLYSPDLLSAQEELLEARRRAGQSGDRSAFLRESDQRALLSAREKLRLFGLDEDQIQELEARGTANDHMLIKSPLSGVVIHKRVNEGQYVEQGAPIYTVADLTRLWVQLDAYESEVAWLHYGQPVDIQAEAYPGEHFAGTIAFIDPVLNTESRTVGVRVNVDNDDGRLKPGMFVSGTVHARVAKGGKVMDPGLSGKWISPMHPEIVRDTPGDCPICGMDLVLAEDLGFVRADDEASMPLVIPAAAVLKTGRRAIVYVEARDAERPTYAGREVVLGARAGDYYLVRSGVREGERVVTNGNFNIDSALQIRAEPSMMSMEGESPEESGDIGTFRLALAPVYQAYLDAQTHLAADQPAEAREALEHLPHLIDEIDMTLLEGKTHDFWMVQSRALAASARALLESESIDAARGHFRGVSDHVVALEKRFGHAGEAPVYEVFCPMAFDDGASWLQRTDGIRNPYFGAEMLNCGRIAAAYPPSGRNVSRGRAEHVH